MEWTSKLLSAMLLLAVVVSIQLVSVSPEPVEKCLDGRYHKKSPSPEGPDYADCFSWKNKSCCTSKFTIELSKNRVENIWNFTWNHCGNLSKECERYIKDEECFFQCEPNLIKWHIGKAAVRGVPICQSFCNNWFKACKNDKTCVVDWLSEFNYTSSSYTCPLQSECKTFAELYGDGKGLCNKMWGKSFKYEETPNCMVMRFGGPGNPNDKVTKPVQQSTTIGPSKPVQQSSTIAPSKPVQQSTTIGPSKPVQQSTTIGPSKPVQQSTTIGPSKPVQQGSTIAPSLVMIVLFFLSSFIF